jgi:hypothetical protein
MNGGVTENGGGNGIPTTANNGLTKSTAVNYQWGGTLVKDTIITQAGWEIGFEGGSFYASGTQGSTPVSGAGTRMMWIPEKYAFRAGQVNASTWDDANIGSGSAAFGTDTLASGQLSLALGNGSNATGFASFSGGGGNTISSRQYSFAYGFAVVCDAFAGIAMGRSAEADPVTSGAPSFAIGDSVKVTGDFSWIIGSSASGNQIVNNQNNSLWIAMSSSAGKLTPDIVVKMGAVGIGNVTSPTARLHLQAGTATINTAPLKFNSGTVLTAVENGAMEYDGTHLYFSTGGVRYQIDQQTPAVANQSANLFYSGPISGVAAAPTFRAIGRADLNNLYSKVGLVFTETWASLANWSNVGTPNASVSGGQLTVDGTASSTTNYVKNSSYGKLNYELLTYHWSQTVGTIGASTNGIEFSMQPNSSLGASANNQIGVSILLSTTTTGRIKWTYSDGSVLQNEPSAFIPGTPVQGDILDCYVDCYPDKYVFSYNINGGKYITSTYYLSTIGPTAAAANAVNFAFKNLGQGAVKHTIGTFTVTCNQVKYADILIVGNSIARGSGCSWNYQRLASQLPIRAYANIELLAQPSNSINDINVNEINALAPVKLVVWCSTNDVIINGVTTALADLATFVAAVGALSNTSAPTGYSTANGNLVFCTELPRATSTLIPTFNTGLITAYTNTYIINLNGAIWDGTNTAPVQYFIYDNIHPNALANSIFCDLFIKYFSLTKRDTYTNSPLQPYTSPNQVSTDLGNFIQLGNTTGVKSMIYNGYQNEAGSYLAGGTTACVTRYNSASGFSIAVNSSTTKNVVFTPTNRLTIDYTDGSATLNTGSLIVATAGKGIQIKGGTNARIGTATLVGGTITVSNTSVSANTEILYCVKTVGGTQGFLTTTKINGTSFTITSTNVADTSVVTWILIESN